MADKPFDQFTIEQIAGDLLPSATVEQRIATGFNRNTMINEEGGVDPEQFRMEAMFDRMDAVGKAVLGLTLNCCQCHNHKYDPIAQEEYYKIFAFLNNDHEAQPRGTGGPAVSSGPPPPVGRRARHAPAARQRMRRMGVVQPEAAAVTGVQRGSPRGGHPPGRQATRCRRCC